MALIPGPHGRDQRDTCCLRQLSQKEFCRYRVHRIHHIIIAVEVKLPCRLRQEKGLKGSNPASRIDIQDAGFCHFGFQHSNGTVRRNDLAVDVCHADHIVVDQIQRTDSGPRERFDNIAADTAKPEHRNMRLCQALQCRPAIQQFQPAEFMLHDQESFSSAM